MSGRKLPEGAEDIIAEMRARGCSHETIARKFGVSRGAISWHCLKNAIDGPRQHPLRKAELSPRSVKRGEFTVRLFTAEEDAEMLRLESQGLTLSEIAKRLGRKRNSVYGRLLTLARHEERLEAAE